MRSNRKSKNLSTGLLPWVEMTLISAAIICAGFAAMTSWAAEISSDQRVERTQLQLEYLADITSKAAAKTKANEVNLIHIVRLPDFSDKNYSDLNQPALSRLVWSEDHLQNEWGGRVNVTAVNGKLTIEYDGVPDTVCDSKLFDYARKSYEFKCNNVIHHTKIVGAIAQKPEAVLSLAEERRAG